MDAAKQKYVDVKKKVDAAIADIETQIDALQQPVVEDAEQALQDAEESLDDLTEGLDDLFRGLAPSCRRGAGAPQQSAQPASL